MIIRNADGIFKRMKTAFSVLLFGALLTISGALISGQFDDGLRCVKVHSEDRTRVSRKGNIGGIKATSS